MATKNFSSMSTKKLNALLETATDEDKAQIQEVLNSRANVSAPVGGIDTNEVVVSELTDEEQALADELEAPKTSKKMTDEERKELADTLRASHVNHKCRVVPFNTVEWTTGVIVGVIEDKRANKVMYSIKTDDGRRIVKACTSNLVEVLDEVVEPVRKTRSTKQTLDENGNPIGKVVEEWTDEAIEEAVKAVISNVGKKVSYPKTGALGVEIEGETESGRIVSLVPNKRQHTILYRIEVACEGDDKKYAHKVSTNSSLVIEDELDEQGAKVQEAFKNRRYKEVVKKAAVSPEDAFKAAEAALNKTKEQFEKVQALLAKREEAYTKAKEAYEASLEAEDLA